jgi:outer membrane protein TolC
LPRKANFRQIPETKAFPVAFHRSAKNLPGSNSIVEKEMRKNPVYATIAVTLSMLLALGAPLGLSAQAVPASPAQPAQSQSQKAPATKPAQSAPPLTVTAGRQFMKDMPWFPRAIKPYVQRQVPEPILANSPTLRQMIHQGNLELSMQDAIRLAIENNLDIQVQRYVTWIADTNVLRAMSGSPIRSAQGFTSVLGSIPTPSFDPTITSNLSWSRASIPVNNPFISGTGTTSLTALTNYSSQANFTYAQGFKTGTSFDVAFDNTRTSTTSPASLFNPAVESTLTFGFQQQLLKGFGILPNYRYILEARIGSQAARDTLASNVINDIASVENAYWNLVYARENVGVQETTVNWAQKNLEATKAQLRIGTLAQLDVVTAESELATDQQNLIVAQTGEQQAQTVLLNLITRNPMAAGLEDVTIVPTDSINTPPKVDIIPYRDAVEQAWTDRPDLLAAQLGVKVDNIEIKATRNALLPTMTLFGQYGTEGLAGNSKAVTSTPTAFAPDLSSPLVNATGNPVLVSGQPVYAGTPTQFNTQVTSATAGLLDSWNTLWNNNYPTYAFGLSLSIPLRNRSAQADSAQALLQQREALVQLQALKNSIAEAVRNAQIAMQQGLARVQAAVEATRLAQESLDAEQKNFQLGVATDYDVILYERDLATAQGNEIQAKAALLEAVVGFNQAIGRTLQVHSISIADARRGHVIRTPLIPGTPIETVQHNYAFQQGWR